MATTIEQDEEKWFRNTMSQIDRAIDKLQSGTTYDEFARVIGKKLGVSPETVKNSVGGVKWRSGVMSMDKASFKENVRRGLEDAHSQHKWSTAYREAFTTPA